MKHVARLAIGASFLLLCGGLAWALVEYDLLWVLGALYGAAGVYAVGAGVIMIMRAIRDSAGSPQGGGAKQDAVHDSAGPRGHRPATGGTTNQREEAQS